MAFYAIPSEPGGSVKLVRPVELICFALIVANAVYLATSFVDGIWLVARDGSGVPSDFVNVWAAGRLVLEGQAAAAYDWPTHKAVEDVAIGHPFAGYFGWHYPPPFLFVAAALSLLSYAGAYALWSFGTFPVYLAAIRAIVGNRFGYLLAAAFPPVLANFVVGQNGFLSAGLIGGALILLDRRPIAAGVLIGLLTYKPHLGLLFPIALAAGTRWRVFVSATIVAGALAGASWLAFGNSAWAAFVANIGHTSQVFLSQGQADWAKLQTAFGLTRALGGSEPLAWSVQGVLALLATGATAIVWRSNASEDTKAATLATATMLATPYLYMYDLVVLAVPLAFLLHRGGAHGFLAHETAGIGVACLLLLIFPVVKAPVGFLAVLVVAALVARRAVTERRNAAQHFLRTAAQQQ